MPCGGTGEQRANRSNGLAIAPDDAAHVALSQLKSEDNRAPVGNFRDHHFLGEFDQLSNDEFKKLSHEASLAIHQASVQSRSIVAGNLNLGGRGTVARELRSAAVVTDPGYGSFRGRFGRR
jgi:hypothetical protein